MPEIINNKRVMKNTLMLYIRMGIVMLASLYTSRLILKALGVEDFGIYNVVATVVTTFSFLNITLTLAIRRFLAYELGRRDQQDEPAVFKASLIAVVLATASLVVVLESGGLWFLNNRLNIPIERMPAARMAFHLSILTFVANMLVVPFNSVIVVHEKMDIYAYLGIAEVALKLGLVAVLMVTRIDKIIFLAIITLLISLMVLLVNIVYSRRLIRISTEWRSTDFSKVKEIFTFSAWSIVGTVALMLATQGVNLVMNIAFGVLINAALAVSLQVSNAVNQFVGNFQTAFSPQLTKSYSNEGMSEKTFNFACSTSKMTLFLMMLIGFPLLGNIDGVLDIWLEEVPQYAAVFSVIAVAYVILDGSAASVYTLISAGGDIKLYQILMSVVQVLYFALVYALCKLGFEPVFVMSFNLLCCALLYVTRLWVARKVIGFASGRYLQRVLLPALIPIIVFVAAALLLKNIGTSVAGILIKCVAYLVVAFAVGFLLYLSGEERKYVLSVFKKSK